ncbi:MAG: glycosyltransferase [Acholeplasmataceae bacterium]|nr:glycosyltransferase [Acholeplasmataceae bacterium]
MKVAMVITSLEVGGAEKMVLDLIRRIRDQIEVRLFIIKKNYHTIYDDEVKKLNIHYYYLQASNRIFCIFAALRLRKLLHEYRPDIIHSHLKAADYVYFYYLGSKNFKWVHTVHTMASIDTKFIRRLYLKRPYQKEIIKAVAVSKTVSDSIYMLYRVQPFLIPNGIDLNRYTSKKSGADNLKIIHIGRFVPVKNHSYLVKEFSKLVAVNRKVKLILIGDGPTKRRIVRLVKKAGIARNVRFISFTNEVDKYLREAGIFVLPSLYEGLPLSLLEAMASGLVVVVSRAVPEPVEDEVNGFMFDLEENALFYLLQDIIDNYDKLGNLRENAHLRAQEYAIDTMAKQYLALYERILHD